ncbi:MAG: hypothetical protein CME60_13055 [Halobacteriovoraceae bacterium]|nr:hypothetical protein [Halobacteriovoraceae bacterium]
MFFYNIITFIDFYLFFIIAGLILVRFTNASDEAKKKRAKEGKLLSRSLKWLGAFLIATRVIKLIFYPLFFGHSLSPLSDGNYGEDGHSQAWYECKVMATPFMEGFCSKAVESFSNIDGACYPKRGYHPTVCRRLLKAAYNELPTQQEKDEFVREHVARAKKLKCGKSHYIYNYLLKFAFENKDLRRAVADSCVNDLCCYACRTARYSFSSRAKSKKERITYGLLFLELQDLAQKKGPYICTSQLEKEKRINDTLNKFPVIKKMKASSILEILESKANDFYPGLFDKLNLDYSKYRSDFPPVSGGNKLRQKEIRKSL